MALFKVNNGKLNSLNRTRFGLERDIQSLTEKNLKEIFGLDFVKSEFQLNNLRIDTLAFDPESKSFVIVEYKRDKSISIIDQGYAYLALMLNNKADFILEYNESTNENIKRDDVDWTQSKVIFVAGSYTPHQRKAIDFKDLPFELWETNLFENDLLLFNHIKPASTVESIKTITRSKTIEQVNREVKIYTEADHFVKPTAKIKELYGEIKETLVDNWSLNLEPKKFYLAFKAKTNVVDIELQKNALKCYINLRKGLLKDPQNLTQDLSEKGHWGNGDYLFVIRSSDEIPYALKLIKQSYEQNS